MQPASARSIYHRAQGIQAAPILPHGKVNRLEGVVVQVTNDNANRPVVVFRVPPNPTEETIKALRAELHKVGLGSAFALRLRMGRIQVRRYKVVDGMHSYGSWHLIDGQKTMPLYGRRESHEV